MTRIRDIPLKNIIIPVFLSLFLIGCAGYLNTGVSSVRKANDTLAQGLIASMCGISVGAFYRLKNPVYKAGIRKLCGGSNDIELGD